MLTYNGDSFNQVYRCLLEDAFEKNKFWVVAPRDLKTREISEPVSWTVQFPWECWLTLEGRKMNPFFAAAEIFWICSGNGNAEWITRFNKNMANFADPGKEEFNAPYGKRIFAYPTAIGPGVTQNINQFDKVIDRLLEDNNTRRAAMTLWHPGLDNRDSRDICCNNMVYFVLRDNKLNTLVCQRSNDLIWGTPYNMLQFQHLAMLVVGTLEHKGLRVGRGHHTHVVNSLHVYDDLYRKTLKDIEGKFFETVNQQMCRQYLPYHKFMDLYRWMDHELFKIERFGTGLSELEYMLDPLRENIDSEYWIQLAVMPCIYMLLKCGTEREELRRWTNNNLSDLFNWLIKDFWKGK